MGNERVIFSNRFDRPTLEQIEEEMKNKNYDDNENLMSALSIVRIVPFALSFVLISAIQFLLPK